MRSNWDTIRRHSGKSTGYDEASREHAADRATHHASISWQPVVLSFSFTKSELRHDPWAHIRQKLEPIDVKFLAEYDYTNTTHVVSKKRNTSKVLQALINGKYIVHDAFMEAVLEAATPQPNDNGAEMSALEMDFDGNWPDAMQYLPPRIDAPGNDQPDEIFRPDERRREILDGYTFIFYEEKRYEDLFPAITSAKGKALLNKAVPGETDIDDFIRYVKEIAGEKGLGEFEDGSEGKGVVVVRYLPPPDDEHGDWFLAFYNQVALRLDHRPVEPRDFLPAILEVEPAQLRRPLEFDPTQPEPGMPLPSGPKTINEYSADALQPSHNRLCDLVVPTTGRPWNQIKFGRDVKQSRGHHPHHKGHAGGSGAHPRAGSRASTSKWTRVKTNSPLPPRYRTQRQKPPRGCS